MLVYIQKIVNKCKKILYVSLGFCIYNCIQLVRLKITIVITIVNTLFSRY